MLNKLRIAAHYYNKHSFYGLAFYLCVTRGFTKLVKVTFSIHFSKIDLVRFMIFYFFGVKKI